jgi:hypothetical protein
VITDSSPPSLTISIADDISRQMTGNTLVWSNHRNRSTASAESVRVMVTVMRVVVVVMVVVVMVVEVMFAYEG